MWSHNADASWLGAVPRYALQSIVRWCSFVVTLRCSCSPCGEQCSMAWCWCSHLTEIIPTVWPSTGPPSPSTKMFTDVFSCSPTLTTMSHSHPVTQLTTWSHWCYLSLASWTFSSLCPSCVWFGRLVLPSQQAPLSALPTVQLWSLSHGTRVRVAPRPCGSLQHNTTHPTPHQHNHPSDRPPQPQPSRSITSTMQTILIWSNLFGINCFHTFHQTPCIEDGWWLYYKLFAVRNSLTYTVPAWYSSRVLLNLALQYTGLGIKLAFLLGNDNGK